MKDINTFTRISPVLAVVAYEWRRKENVHFSLQKLNSLIPLIGSNPDHVTISVESKVKTYTYKNFINRDVVNKGNWKSIGFLWKRTPDDMSNFCVEFRADLDLGVNFGIYIDYNAVTDIDFVKKEILKFFVNEIEVLYGIGYTIPYFWDPISFAEGTSSSIYLQETDTFYAAPTNFNERSFAFRREYLADQEDRQLAYKIRDVFELNFLSEGHLKQSVRGVPFGEWIEKSGHGRLTRASEVTWIWEIDPDKVQAAREALGDADFVIVRI